MWPGPSEGVARGATWLRDHSVPALACAFAERRADLADQFVVTNHRVYRVPWQRMRRRYLDIVHAEAAKTRRF